MVWLYLIFAALTNLGLWCGTRPHRRARATKKRFDQANVVQLPYQPPTRPDRLDAYRMAMIREKLEDEYLIAGAAAHIIEPDPKDAA